MVAGLIYNRKSGAGYAFLDLPAAGNRAINPNRVLLKFNKNVEYTDKFSARRLSLPGGLFSDFVYTRISLRKVLVWVVFWVGWPFQTSVVSLPEASATCPHIPLVPV